MDGDFGVLGARMPVGAWGDFGAVGTTPGEPMSGRVNTPDALAVRAPGESAVVNAQLDPEFWASGFNEVR